MKKTKVLNLFAGPGAGKSTLAADVFAKLKHQGQNVELVREYAKELVWRHGSIPEHITQKEILAEQYQRQADLKGQVDLIITDSPLVLSTIYGSNPEEAHRLFDEFDNINYLVLRKKAYNPKGRYQTEDEAKALDVVCEKFATDVIPGTPAGGAVLAEAMMDILTGKLETTNLEWSDATPVKNGWYISAHLRGHEIRLYSVDSSENHFLLQLNSFPIGQFLEPREVVLKWIADNIDVLLDVYDNTF